MQRFPLSPLFGIALVVAVLEHRSSKRGTMSLIMPREAGRLAESPLPSGDRAPHGCRRLVGACRRRARWPQEYSTDVLGLARAPQLATAEEIDRSATADLEQLYAQSPAAQALSTEAKGILIFPHILKAGFLVGAQFGEGVLQQQGQAVAYYSTAGASYGLQGNKITTPMF
jgi:hypothetical protein